jgi:uncharacterized protein (DUF169 family)
MDQERSVPLPVGVKLLDRSSPAPNLPVYHGPAYCDAVHRAGLGEVLQVLPGSIQVCHWAPVVMGLKEPKDRFEQGLAPRLDFPLAGLVLAPLDRFPGEPDLVIVRAGREALQEMVVTVGRESLWTGHEGRLDRSAVPLFVGDESPPQYRLVGAVNRALALLARFPAWQALTQHLFRSRVITAGFEALISRTLADMSVCRNSTAIPLLTGRVNISFFCTGGITWGHNQPQHLTSGWPWPQAQRLLTAPGETDG